MSQFNYLITIAFHVTEDQGLRPVSFQIIHIKYIHSYNET